MSSAFNPDVFLNQTVDEAMSTVREPVPEGEYPGVVDDFKLRMVDIGKGDRAGQSVLVCDIFWNLLDEGLKAQLGREKVIVKQGLFIDTTAEGRISTEKDRNLGLGRVREALDQNSGPWQLPMIKGAGPALVKVKNKPDASDDSIIRDEVHSVTKLS